MTSTSLFKAAHTAAKDVHRPGDSYRVTFGISYRAALAASLAPRTVTVSPYAVADRLVSALDAGQEDRVVAFIGRLLRSSDAAIIVKAIRRKAEPLLLSDSPRFATLPHYAGIVEAHGSGSAV